jgi:2-aminoethylphosphonate-pyruvate transaminase
VRPWPLNAAPEAPKWDTMIEKKMLFTPGPVMTSDAVKAVLLQPDIPHRQPVFEQYVHRIRQNLLRLVEADSDYTAVVVSGSGTAANETALSSIVRPNEEVLLLKNGEFGDRLQGILEVYGYRQHVLDFGWANPYNLEAVRRALDENPAIGWTCMVYHETSTGMRNVLGAIGALTAAAGRKLFVDGVSAIGGEPLDVVGDHIDVCTGVPNKAISGLPGVSFVIARRSRVPALGEGMPRRNVYLNLQKHMEWSDRAEQTPNTPSVQMFVALDAALEELAVEGLGRRIGRYQECAAILRQGLEHLGLRLLLAPEYRSNTVTTTFLPRLFGVDAFIEAMDHQGCVLYPGKGPLLEQNCFQVANMGWITPDDCRRLLAVIEATLRAHNALPAEGLSAGGLRG